MKRRGCNSTLTKLKSFVSVKPHKPKMRENDHEKLMAALFGHFHSTFYLCTQTTYIHTSARGKAIWLSWSLARPPGEYESCCVIHPRKGIQSPLSCPRCLLFPPLWQAPLQPHIMQLTSWTAWHLEILCFPTLPPLPPLHIRWDIN